ncbi:MAG: hypothetical protein JWM02_3420 [Frankiales bacterium]|nr:hypothetical protein [Frankiales bacterium]
MTITERYWDVHSASWRAPASYGVGETVGDVVGFGVTDGFGVADGLGVSPPGESVPGALLPAVNV